MFKIKKSIFIFIIGSLLVFFFACNNNSKKRSSLKEKTDTHSAKSGLSESVEITHIKSGDKDSAGNRAFPSPLAGKPNTSIIFDKTSVDFGNIKQNSNHRQIFRIKNTGNEPLIIAKAKASCGCTVADYPKQPVEPGKIAEIKVSYNSGKQKGKIHKIITVISNTDPKITVLTINANILN